MATTNQKTFSRFTLRGLLVISLALSSCAAQYVPNVINTPLLQEMGSASLAIHTGMAGVDPQLAVAITDQFGIMINASFAHREYETATESELKKFHKHQFVEMGLGYILPSENDIQMEAFAGLGRGKINAYDDSWGTWSEGLQVVNTKFTRYFIQPVFGISSPALEGSAAARLVMVRYDDRKLNTAYLIEPVVTGKVGSSWLKVVCQIGFSLPLNHDKSPISYNPFMLSIGLEAKPGNKSKAENKVRMRTL